MEYWKECISISADEIGLVLTNEQLEWLAEGVKGGFENYNMDHGHDCIRGESEESKELQKLKAKIEKQRIYIATTQPCRHCSDGTAQDSWGRDCTCRRCNGTGRI